MFLISSPLVAVALAACLLQVVHGDLTTSNFMVRSGSQEVVVIDFGLASSQPLAEDKVRMPKRDYLRRSTKKRMRPSGEDY